MAAGGPAKLRGTFDPRAQVALGAVVLGSCVFIVADIRAVVRLVPSESLDLRMVPIGFVLGAAVGLLVGRWRLRALRQILPEIEGRFIVRQGRVVSRVPDGARAEELRRGGVIVAAAVWAFAAFWTEGKVLLLGTMAFYVAGEYLFGKVLPVLRLWLELRKAERGASDGS
jgi:hypothetical protein